MANKQEKVKQHKKMSNKEVQYINIYPKIYRIIAFEFKQQDSMGIKVSLIADMVSSLFYPNDQLGEAKVNFNQLILNSFKQYCFKDEISEEAFCNAMDSVEKYINDETCERFLNKIFRRHDFDKDGYLSWEGLEFYFNSLEFKILMSNYKDENLSEKDMQEIFKRMNEGGDPKGVDFVNFKKHSL